MLFSLGWWWGCPNSYASTWFLVPCRMTEGLTVTASTAFESQTSPLIRREAKNEARLLKEVSGHPNVVALSPGEDDTTD